MLEVGRVDHALGKAVFIHGSELFRSDQVVSVAQGVDRNVTEEVGRIDNATRGHGGVERSASSNLVRRFADRLKGGRKNEDQVDREGIVVLGERLDQADEIVRNQITLSLGKRAENTGVGGDNGNPIAVVRRKSGQLMRKQIAVCAQLGKAKNKHFIVIDAGG